MLHSASMVRPTFHELTHGITRTRSGTMHIDVSHVSNASRSRPCAIGPDTLLPTFRRVYDVLLASSDAELPSNRGRLMLIRIALTIVAALCLAAGVASAHSPLHKTPIGHLPQEKQEQKLKNAVAHHQGYIRVCERLRI